MLENERLILEPTGTSGRTGRGGGEQLGGRRGCPATRLRSIPGCFTKNQPASRGAETVPKTTARAGQLHPSDIPSLYPGSRSSPWLSKVVRAQERSCCTPWPWGGPCDLRHRRGSATTANPAEKARCTEIMPSACSAPLAGVRGERSKNPATAFPDHNCPRSQTASLASARKPDARFWDYREKELRCGRFVIR